MRIPDSYLDEGNPWTDDHDYCAQCGERTDDYVIIDDEPVCSSCEYYNMIE